VLHRCFDTWRGNGDIVAGIPRQDFDLELRRFNGRGWRATFGVGRASWASRDCTGSPYRRSMNGALDLYVGWVEWGARRAIHRRHPRAVHAALIASL
jgi:hypothetical protein